MRCGPTPACIREGNEDAAYAGTRLLAVADGMGGHAAGEVASAAVIEALRPLDTHVPGGELLNALDHAVRRADSALRDMVQANPALHGMGTTLTALLWSGSQLGLAHIGDSRAYLVRDGEVFQITQDHTLVQSLLDEGKITAEEAASHPQRLLLLRALTGDHPSHPDLQLRQARPGDRYLLCSDGLHVAAPADAIARVLLTVADPDQATADLIALAMDGGAPDNITCIVADVTTNPTATPLPTPPSPTPPPSPPPTPPSPLTPPVSLVSPKPSTAPASPSSRHQPTPSGPTTTGSMFHRAGCNRFDVPSSRSQPPRNRTCQRTMMPLGVLRCPRRRR